MARRPNRDIHIHTMAWTLKKLDIIPWVYEFGDKLYNNWQSVKHED